MQLHVLGLVHHTHPTAAWLAGDPVVRDGLTDHADRSMARPCYEPYSSKSMKVQLLALGQVGLLVHRESVYLMSFIGRSEP